MSAELRASGISGLISIDDGGSSVCVITKHRQEMFVSVKGLYGKRNLTNANGKHDFVVDYLGKSYVAGSLAKYDCAMPLKMHTDTKQHIFFDLSVLIAIHQYGYLSNNVIVSVPIEMHTEEEKQGRINRLKGSHTVVVNGVSKTFAIADVKVAPESAVSFWVNEPSGKAKFIDLGSRTIGFASTINENGENRFIDMQSGTIFGKGLEALGKQYDSSGLADFICGELLAKWDMNDKVFLLGGGSLDNELVEQIKTYFPKAEVMQNPQMANAIGMYNLGRVVYGMD